MQEYQDKVSYALRNLPARRPRGSTENIPRAMKEWRRKKTRRELRIPLSSFKSFFHLSAPPLEAGGDPLVPVKKRAGGKLRRKMMVAR